MLQGPAADGYDDDDNDDDVIAVPGMSTRRQVMRPRRGRDFSENVYQNRLWPRLHSRFSALSDYCRFSVV